MKNFIVHFIFIFIVSSSAIKPQTVLITPKLNGSDKFYSNWQTLISSHFIFHFPPNTVVNDKMKFAYIHEQAFEKINTLTKSSLPKKIDYFVWNYSAEAEKFGLNELSFALPEQCIIHAHVKESVGHEITHVLTHFIYSNKKVKTKLINEGIATYFDLNNNAVYGGRDFKKPTEKIFLKEAWHNDFKYSDFVYYFMGAELIKILNQKFGKEKLLKLLANQSYENAKQLYGVELDKILADIEKRVN